jgi:hypothetical protein
MLPSFTSIVRGSHFASEYPLYRRFARQTFTSLGIGSAGDGKV